MKLAKIIMVICVVLLIILAETQRINILRRLGIGVPVSDYELHVNRFLQSLSFAPVGLAIGITALFFPQHILRWQDKLLGKIRAIYSPLELWGLRLAGLLFIITPLIVLWTNSHFLFP